ncbi:kinase-like domain-containing protein [Hyaloscypha sp. PMI_1271]|nr:kinase-like domain-containing protein [Hyaloscypha sp. PMI_1271]
MIGMTLSGSLHILDVVNTMTHQVCAEYERVMYKAFDSRTQLWYAVKAFNKTSADLRQYEESISFHYEASAHPNIIPLIRIVHSNRYLYTVMPYYPEGNLFDRITQSKRTFDDDSIRNTFLQLLDAVEHCHHLGVYHLDLKPEHILVSGDQILLTGFDLSTTEETAGYLGSTFYASPENRLAFFTGAPYRCAPHDIWSLGVILVNLTCRRNPWKEATFDDPTYVAFMNDRNNFLRTILPLSEEANSILCQIFDRDPSTRISIQELKHEVSQCPSFRTELPCSHRVSNT